MNNEVKEIVNSLGINEVKEELKDNREKAFKLKCLMSRMTFDRSVGLYAFYNDKSICLAEESVTVDDNKKEEIYRELEDLEKKMKELEKHPKVLEYKKAFSEYYYLLSNEFEYYTLVNIDLRRELSKIKTPNIFVAQPDFNFDKHIIDSSPLLSSIMVNERDIRIIEPVYKMESNRDFRHFYNKTSFKYLEGVCEDYDLDLGDKKLGKVRVKSFNL